MLTPRRSSPRGGALSARQVALWAGWLFQPSERVQESRAAATTPAVLLFLLGSRVQALLAPVARVRQNLRLSPRHGGSGRDAGVPGSAETAAERAADPGVRPGLGVWVPRRSA